MPVHRPRRYTSALDLPETSPGFHQSLDYHSINFRNHPELYRTPRREEDVHIVEPYKSEVFPYWSYKTLELAEESSEKLYQLFLKYKRQRDFVGMDAIRQFLRMGYIRARRYARPKMHTAKIFYTVYQRVRTDPIYENLKAVQKAYEHTIDENK